MMKRILSLLTLLALVVQSCQPDPYKEIGPDYSLTEGITGTWTLSTVSQTDETQPVPETVDISDFFQDDPLVMSFDYSTSTYTVDNVGGGGNIFGDNGSFGYNETDFPSMIMMYTNVGDTLSMDLTQMVRKIDTRMGFKVTRNRCDGPNITYEYDFNRQ
jgi:hypothetical protein